MTLQLEVGKYYRNRDGDKVGPLEENLNDPYSLSHPFKAGDESFRNDGLWSSLSSSNKKYGLDLIEEWKDEESKTVEVASGGGMKVEQTAEEVIAQRQNTHGDFTDNARVMQALKRSVMNEAGWLNLSDVQREALHMILHKVGRIVSGNPNEPDHWLDIAGYATLAKDRVSS